MPNFLGPDTQWTQQLISNSRKIWKSLCDGCETCYWGKKNRTKMDRLKKQAFATGVFTIFYSAILFIHAIIIYYAPNSKPDNSTLLTSINETKTENSTTYDDVKQNSKNSTLDDAPGFNEICSNMLLVHLTISSLMFLYGAKKEYKNLLLPWMIIAPPSMIGLLISFFLYPSLAETQGWAIYNQIYSVLAIFYIVYISKKAMEYFGLLVERDRVKKASNNSRPSPPDLLNETAI